MCILYSDKYKRGCFQFYWFPLNKNYKKKIQIIKGFFNLQIEEELKEVE